jgi:hypothetical protein
MDQGVNSVMATKRTIEEFRLRLNKIVDKKKLGKAVMDPLRKGQRKIAGEAIGAYWQHNLGRIIWEWRKRAFGIRSGPMVLTKKRYRTRYSASQESYIAPLQVAGLAYKVEHGGRLEVHKVFGGAIRGRAEFKPGVIVSRRPTIHGIIDREWPRIVDDAETSFYKFVERTL